MSPIYQGTIGVFHHHILPLFSVLPPLWETAHQKHGHLSVRSWTRSQPNCLYIHFLWVFLSTHVFTTKTKGRQGAAQPSLVPEESSISAGCDPGGQMCSCGERTHPGWTKALLLGCGSWRRGWTHQAHCKADSSEGTRRMF